MPMMKLDDLNANKKVTLAQQFWDSVADEQDVRELTTAQKTN